MTTSNFDESTQSLWVPVIEKNKLYFNNKYGDKKEGTPENSLIYEKDLTNSDDKYNHILNVASYNPVNPIQYIEEGCSGCGSKYLKYVRIGEQQNVIYVCPCLKNKKNSEK